MENIKVYKFYGCDMIATKENLQNTMDWYKNIYDEIETKDVEVVDVEKTKIWYPATEEDLKNCQEDDLKEFYDEWYVRLTIKEALKREPEYVSPYVIASTEI